MPHPKAILLIMTPIHMIDYDDRLSRIHDFLYANGSSRVGSSIAKEFGHIVNALSHEAKTSSKPLILDPITKKLILDADNDACKETAARVRNLFSKYRGKSPNIDNDAEIESSDLCIARVVAELDGIDLLDSRRDWIGDALEKFRTLEAKRLGGQFFTDQRVTELAMDLIEFDSDSDSLVDICSGTGGFLLAAARRIPTSAKKTPHLIGVEVDDELVRAGRRSLGHLFRNVSIERADSLRSSGEWPEQISALLPDNSQTRLASNPPFGTKIRIVDKAILDRFELARSWSKKREGMWTISRTPKPTSPDILFIERNLQLARPGGKIVLVLPYQILSGPQLEYVREWMMRHAYIRAVIDCPSETFQPWTGTKTGLILLEKREKPLESSHDSEDYKVFMSVGHKIGHDRRGKPVFNDIGEIDSDFPSIGSAFNAFRQGKKNMTDLHSGSFVLSIKKILQHDEIRLNASSFTLESNEAKSVVDALAARPGWKLSTIGNEVDSIFFPNRFKRTYVQASEDGAIPFLGGSQILSIEPADGKFVRQGDPHIGMCIVSPGWVLVTRSGSTGIVSSVPDHWEGFAVSEHVIRIVPREGGLPAGYIESYLSSELGQVLISSGVFGSVIDEITPDHIRDIPIPIPTSSATKKKVEAVHQAICLARHCRSQAASAMQDSRKKLKNALA